MKTYLPMLYKLGVILLVAFSFLGLQNA